MNQEIIAANSKRQQDYDNDLVVQEFLNTNFYKSGYQRFTDKVHQYAGIDLIWDGKKIDEKASTYWTGLTTFAHEIGQINRSYEWQRGWMLNPSSQTEYYLYAFLEDVTRDGSMLQSIQEAEVMLVSKEKVLGYLQSLGWGEKELLLKDTVIRDAYETFGQDWKHHVRLQDSNVKFVLCENKFEKPVNVLIKRDVLRELSEINTICKRE